MTEEPEEGYYWDIEGVISDIQGGDVSDADITTLRRVQEEINIIQRNYKQLAEAMGADIDLATHDNCIEVAHILNRIKTGMIHNRAADTGTYFISGEIGDKDDVGLPDKILVTPTYGLNGFAVYRKERNYSEPGH